MENSAQSRVKSYLTAIGAILLTLGLAFILAYIFNQTNLNPTESANQVTIHGEDRKYNIIGRRLVLSDGNYFTGIPYATSTKFHLGKLAEMETEVKAIKWPPECVTHYYKNGTLNCLTLNVYQCTQTQDPYLPVLVYVHEGEQSLDATANLDANRVINNLACKGMVVVSVHYRQSIFGAFNLITPNLAATDIELALKWIKKNIKSFNGDSRRVTLMGSRQGARLASYLSRKEETKDLFHRLILVSGAVNNPEMFPDNHQQHRRLIKHISTKTNCTDRDEDLESMTRKELQEVVNCVAEFNKKALVRMDNRLRGAWLRWPIDNSELPSRDDVLKPMDVMLGTCKASHVFNNDIQIAKFRLRRTLNKTADFLRTYDPEEFSEHYYGQFVNTTLTLPEAMRQVRHDFIEIGPMMLDAFAHAQRPNSNVFVFNLETERTRNDYNPELRGMNVDRLAPCMEHLLFRKVPKSEQSIQKFMSESLANFVINGNPNKQNGTLKWSEFSTPNLDLNTKFSYNVLNVNANGIEVQENWRNESVRFWLCEQAKARNSTSIHCS